MSFLVFVFDNKIDITLMERESVSTLKRLGNIQINCVNILEKTLSAPLFWNYATLENRLELFNILCYG